MNTINILKPKYFLYLEILRAIKREKLEKKYIIYKFSLILVDFLIIIITIDLLS